MATADGNDANCQRSVRRFVENDMQTHRQRSEDVLLRTAKERQVVLQASKKGSR